MRLLLLLATCVYAHAFDGMIVINDMKVKYVCGVDRITVDFVVEVPGDRWLGFGVSPDGKMAGSDIVACSSTSNYKALRYFQTGYVPPTGGEEVPGATCGFNETTGMTYITFSRHIAAETDKQVEIFLGKEMWFVGAYGAKGTRQLGYHGGNNRLGLKGTIFAPKPAMNIVPPTKEETETMDPEASLPFNPDEEITVTGLVSDNLCIDQPWKLTPDNANITHMPWTHKRWCLNEIPFCYNSGFGVLEDTKTDKGFKVAYRLDDAGNRKLLELLKPLKRSQANLQAKITGRVTSTSTKLAFYNGKLIYKVGPPVRVLDVSEMTLITDAPTPVMKPTPEPVVIDQPTPKPAANTIVIKAMTVKYELSADQKTVTFTATVPQNSWMAFGVSKDGSMVSDSEGSDIVVCSSLQVERHFVKQYSSGEFQAGKKVDSATCTYQDGKTTLQFTRNVAASGDTERAISLESQWFIGAYGERGRTSISYHGSNRSPAQYGLLGGGAVTSAPTRPPAPTAALAGNVIKLGIVQVQYEQSDDKKSVTFTATTPGERFFGFGVSKDGTMNSGGDGSDIVVCDKDGKIHRSWVKGKSQGAFDKKEVDGSCTYKDGTTKMEFTRLLSAGDGEREIVFDGNTNFIAAWAGGKSLAYHGADRAVILYNLATGGSSEVVVSPPATMWAHMIFMGLSWGSMLPFGVISARYQRANPTKIQGAPMWFFLHRTCQYTGWLFQLVGVFMAILYVHDNGEHFKGVFDYHMIIGIVVVILGTLQPLNAFFRPHPEPRSTGRVAWEYLHKGAGYSAVILGIANVVIGVYVATEKKFEDAFVGLAGVFVGISGILVLYVLFKEATGGKQLPPPAPKTVDEEVPLKPVAGAD